MNNKLNSMKQFFKKEGFYVILFVCLCAVATVAAVTASKKNNNSPEDKVAVQQVENEVVNQPEKPDNALQVQEELELVPVVENDNTQAVAAQTEVSFNNPVEGTLGRAYSEDPVYWSTTKDYKTHKAMDIKASEGASVIATSAGVVKKISESTEGKFVEIDHQNGVTTVYGNLQTEVAVNEGDTVTSGQEIGKVGNDTNLAYEEYGTYLHFEVLENGEAVDPAKYVNYEK